MRFWLFALLFLVVTGCSKADLGQYQNNTPELNLFDYFQGYTRGWGIVQNRSGDLTRQFVVDIHGTSTSNTLTLKEDFSWSDGEETTRIWTIARDGNARFAGTAADVSGTAEGEVSGNVLNWNYHLNLAVGDRTWKVAMDDWMFLQQDQVLINKTKMSKFGIHLADITITFMKPGNNGEKL